MKAIHLWNSRGINRIRKVAGQLADPLSQRDRFQGFENCADEAFIGLLKLRMNERLFEVLYQRHVRWVWTQSFQCLTNSRRHFTWDICLRTFHFLRGQFPESESARQLTSLLAEIVRTLAKNSHDLDMQKPGCPEDQWMEERFNWAAGDESLARGIQQAMKQLPAEWRQVMNWRYLEEISLAELASRKEFPFGTIRWRHFQAVRKIREILEEDHGLNRSENNLNHYGKTKQRPAALAAKIV
jgi:DNA-directed RNA polymerase specialized sigma24 family protein